MNENKEILKRIAQELEGYTSGRMYKCPECGKDINIQDVNCTCPCCEEQFDVDEWEPLTISDYLADVLDIEYIISSQRRYTACIITLCYGGPNVYLNTRNNRLELFWGNNREELTLSDEVINAVDEEVGSWYFSSIIE